MGFEIPGSLAPRITRNLVLGKKFVHKGKSITEETYPIYEVSVSKVFSAFQGVLIIITNPYPYLIPSFYVPSHILIPLMDNENKMKTKVRECNASSRMFKVDR